MVLNIPMMQTQKGLPAISLTQKIVFIAQSELVWVLNNSSKHSRKKNIHRNFLRWIGYFSSEICTTHFKFIKFSVNLVSVCEKVV